MGDRVALVVDDRLRLCAVQQRPVDPAAAELAQQLADVGGRVRADDAVDVAELGRVLGLELAQHEPLAFAREVPAIDELAPENIGLAQRAGGCQLQRLHLLQRVAAVLAQDQQVHDGFSAGRHEEVRWQAVGAHELGHQRRAEADGLFLAALAGHHPRRADERRQAAGLELFERAQDEVAFQRLVLVLVIAAVVLAARQLASERHVRHHGVIDIVRRAGGHRLEVADGAVVPGPLVHQPVDLARGIAEFDRVHCRAGRGRGSEDANAAAGVQHLAAGKAHLLQQPPRPGRHRGRGVILVVRPLHALADQVATEPAVARQDGLLAVVDALAVDRTRPDLVQQLDGRGVVALALAGLTVRVVFEEAGRRAGIAERDRLCRGSRGHIIWRIRRADRR